MTIIVTVRLETWPALNKVMAENFELVFLKKRRKNLKMYLTCALVFSFLLNKITTYIYFSLKSI